MTAEVTWPASTRKVPTDVPSKCASAAAAGSPANPCLEPGSLLRCHLCPDSPNYWRREAA